MLHWFKCWKFLRKFHEIGNKNMIFISNCFQAICNEKSELWRGCQCQTGSPPRPVQQGEPLREDAALAPHHVSYPAKPEQPPTFGTQRTWWENKIMFKFNSLNVFQAGELIQNFYHFLALSEASRKKMRTKEIPKIFVPLIYYKFLFYNLSILSVFMDFENFKMQKKNKSN